MTTLKTVTVEELAYLLNRAVSTIQADASRRPHTLPPRLQIPGVRRLLWLESDVNEWLKTLQGKNGKKTRSR